MKENAFIHGGIIKISFKNGTILNDEFVDYVSEKALESIINELPDDARTCEIVRYIIKRIDDKVEGLKIIL